MLARALVGSLGLMAMAHTALAGRVPEDLFHFWEPGQESAALESAIQNSTEGYFSEAIDHFGQLASADASRPTFQQRYFINTSFADTAGSPVIFLVCGEYTCDPSMILQGVQLGAVDEYVRELHANLVILEHRYYGKSQPFADLSTGHLKYLATDQAVEDMAQFHRFIESRYGLTGKWISIGGSYAGVLSADFRLKHPELDAGALSSSGPVRIKVDFWEYDRHMTEALSPECAAVARKTVAYFEGALTNPTLMQSLRKSYQMDDSVSDLDVLDSIEGTVAGAVQYGSKDDFCRDILGSDPIAGWFAASVAMGSLGGSADLSDITDLGSGARQWTYQTCVEYGYFQTANPDPNESLMPRRDTLDDQFAPCRKYFGIARPPRAETMNHEYYDHFFEAGLVSNILFTNAEDDPWSELGIRPDNSAGLAPGLTTFEYGILGHHGDLKPTTSDTPPSVLAAQALFLRLAKSWSE